MNRLAGEERRAKYGLALLFAYIALLAVGVLARAFDVRVLLDLPIY